MTGGALAGRRILLGITGGIAAYKAAYLARLLRERGADVNVVMTPAATRFVGPDTFAALTGNPVHSDVFEHSEAVLHVRLAREADAAVVAPATANLIAKVALGLADDLLTSTLLEHTGPLVMAPAMHTGMHSNPATQQNLATLHERGVVIVGPVEGALAAGDEGMGRMAAPEAIAAALERVVSPQKPDLAGRRILVTAGPTYEPIDAVRFIGNRSSGRMGFAVAQEAARRGAVVELVAGPTSLEAPAGVLVTRVGTADEMREEVLSRFEEADAVIMAAAVADYRVDHPSASKIKKEGGPPQFHLEATPDILLELGERKGARVLVGFAAETDDLEKAGRLKLERKNLDMIVVNKVGQPGTGFNASTNWASIASKDGSEELFRKWTKPDLARAICDRLAKLFATA